MVPDSVSPPLGTASPSSALSSSRSSSFPWDVGPVPYTTVSGLLPTSPSRMEDPLGRDRSIYVVVKDSDCGRVCLGEWVSVVDV